MRRFFLRFLCLACCLGATAVGLTWLLREQLFHPVDARCLSGEWVAGGKRGFAILLLQYEWDGKTYDNARTFGPLDDSPRVMDTPADVQRGRDWIATECRPQPAWIMRGQPSLVWFRDARSWHSVIVNVILRSCLLAAIGAGAWTLIERLARRRHG